MANNQYVNKVVFGNNTILDISEDTVVSSALLSGYTAHAGSGASISGSILTKTSSDLTANGLTVTVPSGYYGTAATKTLTDANLLAANIKEGITIFGITGSYVGGGSAILQEKTNITPTESSQTIEPDDGYDGLSSVQINAISADYIGSNITTRSSTDLSASGATVTVPAGYYSTQVTKDVASGSEGTPIATKGSVSNHSIVVTPSVTNVAGYISGGTHAGTDVSVSASELVSGNKEITTNGTDIDVTNYATVSVSIIPSLQSKTNITPTESSQTISADNGYYGLSSVQINGISATYVGSNIDRNDSTDLTTSGATVNVPAGYYAEAASKSVDSMTLPTSATSSATSGYTSKATISRSTSDQYINIPTGYNAAGAYYKINAVANGSATAPASISGTSATISTGTNTITLTKTVSVTPSVTAGYISSGTAGNSSVSLTASMNIRSSSDLTASGATVTVPAGYYSSEASKSVTTMTLPTSGSASATSGYTSKATISRSTSNQYINIPPGYNSAGGYYTISAVPNGSATGPTSVSGSSATLSTGTNTITLTKTGVTTTPTVNAGYVSSATASTATVTLTASVTTKAAATITPGTSDQTIASGTYLTGTQTISGDADLIASNIKTGVGIFGVTGTYTADATAAADEILSGETAYVNGSKLTGTLTITTVYVGSAAPSASTGINGDIYIKS